MCVWTKNPNCWEILRKFWHFWWKFYRKIEFIIFYFFENLLLKLELSEITQFFYNIFFCFGGGFPFPLPTPLGLTLRKCWLFFKNNRWNLENYHSKASSGIFLLGIKRLCSDCTLAGSAGAAAAEGRRILETWSKIDFLWNVTKFLKRFNFCYDTVAVLYKSNRKSKIQ